jgi:hypothetical protein
MRETERSRIHIVGFNPRNERGEVVSDSTVDFLLGGEGRRIGYRLEGQMCEFADTTSEFRVCDSKRTFLFIFEAVE